VSNATITRGAPQSPENTESSRFSIRTSDISFRHLSTFLRREEALIQKNASSGPDVIPDTLLALQRNFSLAPFDPI
jgi:hypothetical protein